MHANDVIVTERASGDIIRIFRRNSSVYQNALRTNERRGRVARSVDRVRFGAVWTRLIMNGF